MQCQTLIQKVTFVRFIKMPLFLKFSLPDDGRRNKKNTEKEKLKKIKQRNGTERNIPFACQWQGRKKVCVANFDILCENSSCFIAGIKAIL